MTLILFLDVGCYFVMITAVCTNGPSLQNVLLHFNSYSIATTTLLKEKFPFTVQYEVSLGMAADTSTA